LTIQRRKIKGKIDSWIDWKERNAQAYKQKLLIAPWSLKETRRRKKKAGIQRLNEVS